MESASRRLSSETFTDPLRTASCHGSQGRVRGRFGGVAPLSIGTRCGPSLSRGCSRFRFCRRSHLGGVCLGGWARLCTPTPHGRPVTRTGSARAPAARPIPRPAAGGASRCAPCLPDGRLACAVTEHRPPYGQYRRTRAGRAVLLIPRPGAGRCDLRPRDARGLGVSCARTRI